MGFRGFAVVLMCMSLVGLAWAKPDNLARTAKAVASENQAGLPAELANDGRDDTRWSGIPGHNAGVWYELDWAQPVSISQVVIKQYQTYSWEWDLQVWDETQQMWSTVQHDGKSGTALPLVVVDTLGTAVKTTKLRIRNITHGPSFNEVEVYSTPNAYEPVVSMASDLRGNFVGILCDSFGSAPIANKTVDLLCDTNHGAVRTKTTTNDKGLFFAKMPVGLRGMVYAEVEGHRHTFPATMFQRAIMPLDRRGWVVSQNPSWKFQVNPPAGFEQPGFNDSTWKAIKVPAHWELEGHRGDLGGYRCRFDRPKQDGERTMIRFDGVYSGAEVFVNGMPVASHLGGFTPFEVDVTPYIHEKDNVLALKVTEHTVVSDDLDKMSIYADFGLGGIMRDVHIFNISDLHIEAFQQQTNWLGKNASMTGGVSLVNVNGKPATGSVRASLIDAVGTVVAQSGAMTMNVAPWGTMSLPFSFDVAGAKPWSAEKPYLYTIKFEVVRDGKMVQVLRQPVGFRQTTIVGTQILINGTPVKFKGTCHHDQDPLLGRAVTPAIEMNDVQMIKNANLNSLRTSHYPPHESLIDAADKVGLYVEDEADFCWVGVSNDLRNTPRILQLTGELIARDRNHPSVFMWSLCNESEFGYGFERSHEWVRSVDGSRPTGAATSAWLEIATHHNPISIRRIEENEKIDEPLLFDEAWCIYQGIWGDVAEMWVDPGIRDYYAEPLKGVWDAFMKSKTTQGSQIWAWSDDIFCVPGRGLAYGRGTTMNHFVEDTYSMPGRGLAGDAPWGVVDGWRREKPEYWTTKHLQSPIRVEEHAFVPNQETVVSLENQFDFTDLSELVFAYTYGAQSAQHYATVTCAPHAQTTIQIPASASGPIVLTAATKSGRIIDRWRFAAAPTPVLPTSSGSLSMKGESWLAGDTIAVDGPSFHLNFDKSTGLMRECFAGGEPTLLELPMVHILPASTPESEMPKRTGWKTESSNFFLSPDLKTFRMTVNGSYPDLKGKYVIEVNSAGLMTVKSDFEYTGATMLAREIGLRFSVPKGCDLLSWNRNSDFGWMPDNHIGRPAGSAFAFAKHDNSVPPKWGYAADNSPMGTNDFRSTKRHLNYGSIRYRGGAGVGIFSDGKQALRAIVDSDRISVHLSDWYGGTNTGLGEWISNYGRGKEIKAGDHLKSEIRLELVKRK